jgi:tetratricopeptide (TPR) repeat protein
MRTLAGSSFVNAYHMRWAESLDQSLSAIALADRVADLNAEVVARFTAAISHYATGKPDAAEPHAIACQIAAEKLRDRSWLSRALWGRQCLASVQGDWDTAKEFSDRALLVVWPDDPRTLFSRALQEYETGSFRDGAAYLDRLVDNMNRLAPSPSVEYIAPAYAIAATGRIAGDTIRLDVAKRAANLALSSEPLTGIIEAFARMGLALAAVQQNDAESTEEQYAALRRTLPGTTVPLSNISGDRVLGLLASNLRRTQEAAQHFEDAVTYCSKAGYRPELAWASSDYAELLIAQETLDGRQRVLELHDTALEIARELNMKPLIERILRRREILKA